MSHLAREIGISRPLLHLHLQRLEAAGLDLHLSAEWLAEAAATLTPFGPGQGDGDKERN